MMRAIRNHVNVVENGQARNVDRQERNVEPEQEEMNLDLQPENARPGGPGNLEVIPDAQHEDAGEDRPDDDDHQNDPGEPEEGPVEEEEDREEYDGEEDGEEEDRDEDDYEDGDDRMGIDPNAPLFQGAPVTARESMALVLSMMMQHNLTGSCVSDLLDMINLICPQQGQQKLSYYKFRKYFGCSRVPMNKIYYCSNCFHGLRDPNEICDTCREPKGVSYFVQLPIIPQLRELYKRRSFFNSLQHRLDRGREGEQVIGDIYDGALYKEQVGNGFLADPNNISLTWYTDGAPVFKSRNYSIWPFSYIINELPYKLRTKRENILLGGLWFGPKKPEANMFMRSFLPDLRALFNGVHITPIDLDEQIVVRGVVLAGVCDTPAKSTFLNCVAHNGFHGCPVCEIRGETLRRQAQTDKHVYRFQENLTKRTPERMLEFARLAANSPHPVVGIKGPTVLRLIMPDFLRGTAIDPMHLVGGVVKKLLKLHFSSKCSTYPFSMRAVLGAADVELLNMKPPKFIHRAARSLEEYDRWKASQLMAWFFYYSLPIYKGILPPRYFHHYLKFVNAICYLNSDSVTPQMIDLAQQLLMEFVRDFEVLYDLKFCSINIHLLLHLADCVRDLGPLWVYSCFPMENLNGLMLGTIHGKTSVDSQVCNGFWQNLNLPRRLEAVGDGTVLAFIKRRRRQVHINERVEQSCYSVGYYSDRGVNHPIVRSGFRAAQVAVGRLTQYFRLLKDGMLFVAETYSRDNVSKSCFVSFQSGEETRYGSIFTFVKNLTCDCAAACACGNEHFAIIRFAERAESFRIPYYQDYPLQHINRYQMTMVVKAVPVSQLKTVCFYMHTFNSIYIAQPVNSMEVEF